MFRKTRSNRGLLGLSGDVDLDRFLPVVLACLDVIVVREGSSKSVDPFVAQDQLCQSLSHPPSTYQNTRGISHEVSDW